MRAMDRLRLPMRAAVLRWCGCLALLLGCILPERAWSGAWLLPQGTGQVIVGAALSRTTRAFDARGRLIPVPYYKKFELGTYIEYGLTDRVTLVAAPAYDRVRAPPPAESYNGLGESEGAVRLGLYRDGPTVVSVQGGVRTPGPSVVDSAGPFNPRRGLAIELRGLIGRGVEVATMPAFIDVQGGYRYYIRNQPGEWHLDLTFGLRPVPRLLWLVQSFSTFSNMRSGAFVPYSWTKLASSIVLDLHPRWSLQCGGFLTLAGVNAGRELGPFASVWLRF